MDVHWLSENWHILWHRINKSLRWRHNGPDSVSNHQPHDCLLNRLFRHRSKKTSKLRVTGLCAGNSPGTGEFTAQMASYAENVSIWWRHHVFKLVYIENILNKFAELVRMNLNWDSVNKVAGLYVYMVYLGWSGVYYGSRAHWRPYRTLTPDWELWWVLSNNSMYM